MNCSLEKKIKWKLKTIFGFIWRIQKLKQKSQARNESKQEQKPSIETPLSQIWLTIKIICPNLSNLQGIRKVSQDE